MDERIPDGTQSGDDRLMMMSPKLWGHWPILTLKRLSKEKNKSYDVALLYDRTHEGEEHSRSFRLLAGVSGPVLGTIQQLRNAPIVDIDKILLDGWIVD